MKKITVDFSKKLRKIKPLHGINNSPVTYGEKLPELTEAGIPAIRTHDTAGEFGGSRFIDIPNLFPDFEADPADPASYDFAFTDAYLKGLTDSGCKIFYRLGVTIENHYKIRVYRINPPADFLKWAKICEGVIRHYNEGWANGFRRGIEYWEIWNEPENPPMWAGTCGQFFEFYRTVANYLKKTFPSLKIGGYGSCGFYAVTRENQSDFFKGFVTFFVDFLNYISTPETKAPLDFFSWHFYSDGNAEEIIRQAEFVDSELKKHGLDRAENIFDEWNYCDWSEPANKIWDKMKEMPGASFVAETFCRLQNSPVDKAFYYDALPTRSYCGLYYFPSKNLTKTYYAFKAFNLLHSLGDQAELIGMVRNEPFQAIAAGNPEHGAILLVNRCPRARKVSIRIRNGAAPTVRLLLDSKNELNPIRIAKTAAFTMPPQSVSVVLCGELFRRKDAHGYA